MHKSAPSSNCDGPSPATHSLTLPWGHNPFFWWFWPFFLLLIFHTPEALPDRARLRVLYSLLDSLGAQWQFSNQREELMVTLEPRDQSWGTFPEILFILRISCSFNSLETLRVSFLQLGHSEILDQQNYRQSHHLPFQRFLRLCLLSSCLINQLQSYLVYTG